MEYGKGGGVVGGEEGISESLSETKELRPRGPMCLRFNATLYLCCFGWGEQKKSHVHL